MMMKGYRYQNDANVAELADALDLGSSAREGLGVRFPPFAPFIPKDLSCKESFTS